MCKTGRQYNDMTKYRSNIFLIMLHCLGPTTPFTDDNIITSEEKEWLILEGMI